MWNIYCPANQYLDSSTKTCKKCSANQTSPAGSTSSSQCVNTPINSTTTTSTPVTSTPITSTTTTSTSNSCQSGQILPNGTCKCNAGYEYSNEKCTKCPAGYGSLPGGNCVEVIKYFYANPNQVPPEGKARLYYEILATDKNDGKGSIPQAGKCTILENNKIDKENILEGKYSHDTQFLTTAKKYELSCPNTTSRFTTVSISQSEEV